MSEYIVHIPHCYSWMANGNKNLYLAYIKGYIKSSHPDYKPVRIKGNVVICVKK